MSKIVGILQNQWFRDPDRVRGMLASSPVPEQLRKRLIAYALFAGCKTGRILRVGLGEPLCDTIIWEEASPEIGGHYSSVFPPDIPHLRKIISVENPDIVIAFGKVAQSGVSQCLNGRFRFLIAPHPASRGPDVITALNAVAKVCLQN